MKHSMMLPIVALSLFSILIANNAKADNQAFKQVCSECHTGGFKGWVSGAPDVQDKNEWKKFIQRDSLESMKKIVINGTVEHKKKGGCKQCTDRDIANTIDYMMKLVKQPL